MSAKYIIHTCPERVWYVEKFLIPSMTAQGIDRGAIDVYCDENHDGCLESCMRTFERMPDDDSGTWHMQDDVVISSRFRELTEEHDSGVVCGHCYSLHRDRLDAIGWVEPTQMWFSFPCIRIPNRIARGCAEYYRRVIVPDPQYSGWISAKRYDDTIFSVYMSFMQSREKVLNLVPNVVAHIDYLIGGTVCNAATKTVPETYFDEPERIEELKAMLSKNPKNKKGGDRCV